MVGVCYRKDRDNWQAQFRIHGTGEYKFLGYHKTKAGAMRMYDDYIRDNNLIGYKLNYKKRPYIRKRTEIQSNYDSNIPTVPTALE